MSMGAPTYPDGGVTPPVVLGAGTAADYNGDGYIDYADHSIFDGNTWIHTNAVTSPPTWNAASWYDVYPNFTTSHNSTNSNWEWLVGPMTSNSGRADYLEHWLPTGEFWVHQNYNDGYFAPSGVNWGHGYTHATQGSGGDPGWEFFVADFNGDGWADLVEHYRPTGEFTVYENFHDGGFGSPLTGTGIIAKGQTAIGPRWFMAVADFDGDGYADYADVRPSMNGDTPDAGVYIHLNLHDGGFSSSYLTDYTGAPGPADYGAEVEFLGGRWEAEGIGSCSYGDPSCIDGIAQYMFHNVETGAITPVEYDREFSGPNHVWQELSSATTTAYGTNWETLGTPHRIIQTQDNWLPNGMGYEGGYVEGGLKTFYLLQWGTVPSEGQTVVKNFLSNINGQAYANLFTAYVDLRGDRIDNSYSYWGSYTVSSPTCPGGNDWFDGIESSLTTALNDGDLPVDPTGVYVVIAGTNMQTCTGVCGGQCGFHSPMMYTTSSGNVIQISWALSPDMYGCRYSDAGECFGPAGVCCLLQTAGPNDAPGGDSMVYWLTHEIGEDITDEGYALNLDPSFPDGVWTNHFYSNPSYYGEPDHEEADLCQYNTLYADGGTVGVNSWNSDWGGHKFAIQPTWQNFDGGGCSYEP